MNKNRKHTLENSLKMALPLSKKIGDHKVIDDRDMLEGFSSDESHCKPSMPDLVVRAHCEKDVIALLKLADKFNVPVVPRGAGTGKTGGAIPLMGGVVLDMTKMNAIKEIDKENLIAVVEPGVITGVFQEALDSDDLFYPPDPNSLETCTMGGNVAHNAGGPRAFKYGVTREYILGTTCVSMGGNVFRTGKRTVKGVCGYDITSLLVGSEGTLGVFTDLTVRLIKKPSHIATLLIRMSNEIQGGTAVAKIIASGLTPRVLEFMDGLLVDVIREKGASGIKKGTGCLLLAEVDGSSQEQVESDALKLADLCEEAGAIEVLMARHGGEREALWAARRVLSDAIKEKAAFKASEDIVVPRKEASRMLAGLKNLSKKYGVLVPSYGHAGDGNYHVNILWNDENFCPDAIVNDLFDLTLKLGGTITGEHGVGLSKKNYLPKELSSNFIQLQKSIKSIFDPKGLLNPGKIFK